MKHLILSIFLICVGFIANSQENWNGRKYDISNFESVEFYEDTVVFTRMDEDVDVKKEYPYSIKKKDKLTYLTIVENSVSKEYLVLYNKFMVFLYSKEKNRIKEIWTRTFPILDDMGKFSEYKPIKATSELFENNYLYSIENLRSIDLETPWVEGNPESGIGEKITIKNTNLDALILFSGYISYQKPWLFSQNARPKKVLVTCEDIKLEKVFELEDSPNPQILDLGVLTNNSDIVITILDVYPGDKYKDMCINAIWFRYITKPSLWE